MVWARFSSDTPAISSDMAGVSSDPQIPSGDQPSIFLAAEVYKHKIRHKDNIKNQ
jgi:hypothetical protein